MATSLPSVTPAPPRYIGWGFGILVKNDNFGFVGPIVGGCSPTYHGVRTKRWARLKSQGQVLKVYEDPSQAVSHLFLAKMTSLVVISR